MTSNDVGRDKFRFGERSECDETLECVALSNLDIGWRIGKKIDLGERLGDALEGSKFMASLQSECFVTQ